MSILFLNSYGQSLDKKIIENLSIENNLLLKKLIQKEKNRELNVANYIALNPKASRVIKRADGVILQIRDIIDGKPIYISTDNLSAGRATKTSALQTGGSLGLNLEGTGMTVGVWDGGPIQSTHPEFMNSDNTASRVTIIDNSIVDDDDSGFSSHGTHVAGTIGAKGINPSAKGMATDVFIKSYNWTNDISEILLAVNNNTNPIILSNHSYGVPVDPNDGTGPIDAWIMGAYTSDASQIDELIYNNPQYLMVASAGNSGTTSYSGGLLNGYDKLTTDKNAKNNLVIANANPVLAPFSDNISSLNINSSSSQGPTDDLRIKPDIAADGTNLFSAVPIDGYDTFSGTSMSAPNTTGTLVLIQEYYKQLNNVFMLGATLKGLVCHTSTDDNAAVGPDPKFGWGFLNALEAANVITADNSGDAVIEELNLENGGTYTMTFSASAGDVLRASISWADMPGNPVNSATANVLNNSTARLVNDLDLRISKGSETYLPWKLDFSSGSQFFAIKGDNSVDNLERVDIEVPEDGVYTLTVSHKGTLKGNAGGPFDPQSQDFGLILTGNNLTLGVSDNTLSNSLIVYPNPSRGQFTISFDSNLNNTSDVNIDIYDISGRQVYQNNFENNNVKFKEVIYLNDVTPGVYIATISQGNNRTSQKLIIE
ncbi:S8 family serine peptidase [Winogradskyella wichelsiae]|uniref:S8 family serine peptidase n=1 Tax=Winogradskyella wichelsiae TaxID=2697007 RepID=UPI0015C8D671|nr:S8 family serine peptidase [Winogradskyella wichelsiae]